MKSSHLFGCPLLLTMTRTSHIIRAVQKWNVFMVRGEWMKCRWASSEVNTAYLFVPGKEVSTLVVI